MLCEPPDVHFVDNEVFNGRFKRAIQFPIETIYDYPPTMLIGIGKIGIDAPYLAPAHRFGIRVKQNGVRLKIMTLARLLWSFHAKAILNLLRVEAQDDH